MEAKEIWGSMLGQDVRVKSVFGEHRGRLVNVCGDISYPTVQVSSNIAPSGYWTLSGVSDVRSS